MVPESPRWLLTVQDLPRLLLVLEMASSFNRRALLPGTSTKMKNLGPMQVEYQSPSMMMLFRGEAIKRLSIVSPFISFFSSLTYYGLVLNQSLFNYGLFISGMVEFVAVSVTLTLGAKNDVQLIIATSAISGLACFIAAGFTRTIYVQVVCLVARFFGGIVNCGCTTILATMYPTLIRTMALGWNNFFSNVALAVAANIGYMNHLSVSRSLIILGASAILASISMMFLPGRVSRDLMDLPEEVEYGHKMMRQRNPKDKAEPPRWTPRVNDEGSSGPARATTDPKNANSSYAGGAGSSYQADDPSPPKDIVARKPSESETQPPSGAKHQTSKSPESKRKWYYLFLY